MKTSQMIREACRQQQMPLAELARRIGQSRQNLDKKLRRNTLTHEEILRIAAALGVVFRQSLSSRGPSFLPLLNTAFAPGEAWAAIESMNGAMGAIARAEYYYFAGRHREAARLAACQLTARERMVTQSANIIYGYANLTEGDISAAKWGMRQLREACRILKGSDMPEMRAIGVMAAYTTAVLLHLPVADEVPIESAIGPLPVGLKLFAYYAWAHQKYLEEAYCESLGIAAAALMMTDQPYPIAQIYLHLICAMNLISLKRGAEARARFEAAWELAEGDGFIGPFGEHHALLGGLAETCLKERHPEHYKAVVTFAGAFARGWRKVHNDVSPVPVTESLTVVEFAVAMLASKGWQNAAIAEHMAISVNTVKSMLSVVYQKLAISGRGQLKQHLLK
ncbi:helix-turn-helix domain-containing protein [Pseudoramibacter alactolyticus]